jgi:GR25 family glycosyltransferase involved in LPS biosynthesis
MISKDFPAALRSLKIADYGVIKMDGFSACRHYGPATQMGEFVVRDILDAVPSAACYTISKEAARRLLEDSNQFCATLDDFVFAARKGLRPVQLFPAVAVQGMCCADNQSVPASLATSERAADTHKSRADTGPFTYRFRKELRRTGKKLARTLGANRRLVRRGGVMCRPLLANDLPKYKS